MKFVALFGLLLSTTVLAAGFPGPAPSLSPQAKADLIAAMVKCHQVQHDQALSLSPSPVPSAQVASDKLACASANALVQTDQFCSQLSNLGVSPCPSPSP
jgi:hypothetical protein